MNLLDLAAAHHDSGEVGSGSGFKVGPRAQGWVQGWVQGLGFSQGQCVWGGLAWSGGGGEGGEAVKCLLFKVRLSQRS